MDSIRRHHHGLVLASAVALVLLATVCQASIENEPVKVTHRNSGPSYDFDDVERTRLNPDNAENTIANQPQRGDAPEQQDAEPTPIGNLSIRRIFLVPVGRPESGWTRAQPDESAREQPATEGADGERLQSAFGGSMPLWPFMAHPFQRHQHEHEPHQPHLFGTDEASRSPNFGASNERPSIDKSLAAEKEREETLDRLRPMFDPIQMMVDLMQQALRPAAGSSGLFGDINREANPQLSGDQDNKEASSDSAPGFLGRPLIKPAKNETKEEIVEIEGKKYMRKTVINRHVGDNIIFMTKRLIFVPLNETDSESTITTTTTTTTTTSTTVAPSIIVTDSSSITPEVSKEATEAPKLEQPTTRLAPDTSTDAIEPTISSSTPVEVSVTSTTTTTTTEAPSSSKAAEETTPKDGGWTERVSEAVDRVAERIVELGSSSTTKPEAAEPARQSS